MTNSHSTPIRVFLDGTSSALQRVRFDDAGQGSFDEKWIQNLVHQHPNCLPLDEIEPGFSNPRAICMEFPTPHGPIDNILVTPEGDIALVEVKLWKNPEARRKVIAQALDYASCLFNMDYETFEKAALKGNFFGSDKPDRLYDLFEGPDTLLESAFVDAINANLRRGRILILIAGDGIRTEAERLTDSLQSHAGFHFTLALVELAVFRLASDGEYVVHPRTLAKTCMIERGIVRVEDGQAVVDVGASAPATVATSVTRTSITEEQFLEAMSKRDPALPKRIRSFTKKLESLSVRADYQRSLNLKWAPPEGKPVNLGYILRDGQVWTDAVNWNLPNEVSRPYIADLAETLAVEIEKDALKGKWHIRIDGHAPRIEQLADRLDDWYKVIERFVPNLQSHFSNFS